MLNTYKGYALVFFIGLIVTTMSFAQDTTVLVWTTFDGDALDWLNEQAVAFNEAHPDVVVEVQSFESDENLLVTYNNNESTEPAILHLSDDYTQEIIDLQVVQPIGDVIDGAESIMDVPVHQSEWFDTITAHATVNDTWMMIPIHASTAMTYVNFDLLEDLGATTLYLPEDLMTLELICEEIQPAIEDETVDACVTWDDTAWVFENWLAQQSTQLTDRNNGRDTRATNFNLATDAAWANADLMRYYIESGYATNPSAEEPVSVTLFNEQRVPILFADNTVAFELEPDFTGDVLTSNADFGWSGARLDTENLWLSAFVEPDVAEGAVAFSLFLTAPENNVEWHQATGSLPLTQTAYDLLVESEWAESHPEQINVFRALTDSTADPATLYAIFGNADEIRDGFRFGLDSIILNDVDIEEALQTTEEFIDELLETYNLTSAPDID